MAASRLGPAGGRVIADVRGWKSIGAAARAVARRSRHCVECDGGLESSRTPYCSRRCLYLHHSRFFWDAARIVVLRRDRYTCRACGVRGKRHGLEVDHIVEIARGGPALAVENLQTLCRRCHREKTSLFLRTRRAPSLAGSSDLEPADWFPA